MRITSGNKIVPNRSDWSLLLWLAAGLFCPAFSSAVAQDASPQEPKAVASIDFARQIRPILAKNCIRCHGPDEEAREADLRLDNETDAQADLGGYQAIVPGEPGESALMERVSTEDEDELMPPADSNLSLTDDEIKLLRQWIKSGGAYETQWSFVAPVRPELPKVDQKNWPRNDLDYHVLANLEKNGLVPSPEANRHTMIRRVYLDLIGLLPSPTEVDEWIDDTSPDAYERMVDRLLASPRYGERWARRWLDSARYADTNGYEKDRPRSIWPYRDWVINSINSGMPFDQFTIEQIAGDMLPNATQQQIIATGFHRNTMLNEEGGIDPAEYRFYSLVDRVNTTGSVWLGLTMDCVQCHTHKYDPITHEEFYKMMAFYDNADEPMLFVKDDAFAATRPSIEAKATAMEADLEHHFPIRENLSWIALKPLSATAEQGTELKIGADLSILTSGSEIDKDTYRVTVDEDLSDVVAIRLELLTDPSLPGNGPGWSDGGNFVLSEFTVNATPADSTDPATALKLERATADFNQSGFPVQNSIDGKLTTGWAIAAPGGNTHVPRTATFYLTNKAKRTGKHHLTFNLSQQYGGRHTLGKFRLSLAKQKPDQRTVDVQRAAHFAKTFQQWLGNVTSKAVRWTKLKPISLETNAATLTPLPDDSILAGGDRHKIETYTVIFDTKLANITALRLEALADPSLPHGGPGRAAQDPEGDFFLSDFQVHVAPAGSGDEAFERVEIGTASASHFQPGRHPSNSLDGIRDTAWSISPKLNQSHAAVYEFAKPISNNGKLRLKVILKHEHFNSSTSIGRFRISVTDAPTPVAASGVTEEIESILVLPVASRTDQQNIQIKNCFLQATPKLRSRRAEIKAIRTGGPKQSTTLVMAERRSKNQRTTHRHHRGEFNGSREIVTAGVPKSLPQIPPGVEPNRMAFAKWLVSRDNPLTARVIMNRTWQAFFGQGIVGTIEDFGVQGDIPTNQDLLDFLAVEFMDSGWQMKDLHRTIVTSATYRQSSRITPTLLERDPKNELLARGPRFRVEAEMVRDIALVASGLIKHRLGGASVRPPNAGGITELAYSNSGDGESTGDDRYRRGLYTYWKRTVPYATLLAFDAPTADEACVRRDRTNSPLQALTLLNDLVYVETAQAMAARVVSEVDGGTADRIRYLFKIALARNPSENEIATLTEYFETRLARFQKGDGDAKTIAFSLRPFDEIYGADTNEIAAWTLVCRVLLNLNEMITKG